MKYKLRINIDIYDIN